jgi:predicted acyl esterase
MFITNFRPRIAMFCLVALTAVACGDGTTSSQSTPPTNPPSDPPVAPPPDSVPADFLVSPGVHRIIVTGADPKQPLTLLDADGQRLVTLIADDFGQATFSYIAAQYEIIDTSTGMLPSSADGRSVQPGDGYTIIDEDQDPPEASAAFRVLGRDDHPPDSHYDQVLNPVPWNVIGGPKDGFDAADGLNYPIMRDGVTLSAMVRTPDESLFGPGPWPTVVEYSGYDPSNPDRLQPGTLIANAFGFATVGVNLRGTGCSGGTFDVFDPAQQADGYDLIEIVARQPWVLNNQVGMIGLSYSGITQLFVAATRPPSLAAITPLSVIEDPWQMSWPGGVYNAGFTKEWIEERDRQSAPGGQSWTTRRIEEGDTSCEENQLIRTQSIDFEAFVNSLDRRPEDSDNRDLSLLVKDIEAAVFLTGAWQDEQTGPRFAGMVRDFDNTDRKHFTMFNGHHPDGYQAFHLSGWFDFLELYVGQRVPRMNPVVRAVLPSEMENNFGAPIELQPDRFLDLDDSEYQDALARFEADPPVRILFESGAGGEVPGAPYHRFEATFDTWPPAEAQAWTLYLAEAGGLSSELPATESADSFEFDAEAGPIRYSSSGGGSFTAPAPELDLDWSYTPEGLGLSYLTAPLDEDVVLAGPGYADLWIQTNADDAPIEIVLSEVTPDGNEVRIQTGVQLAGFRKIDEERSGPFLSRLLFGEDDYEPLSTDLTLVRVPIFDVAHPLRAGSRLRVQINTPGRDLPLWFFDNPEPGPNGASYRIARGGEHASVIVLAVLPAGSLDVPGEHPACGVLRGQPCRPYREMTNSPG